MTFVGCDLHTRMQQVAVLDTQTGEVSECQLVHAGMTVEEFYAALPRPVTVGIESTGYAVWFHTLMQRLGHTLLVGDAAKMRAMVVRKTKTDRRDALHSLDLLRHDRFPTIWVPDPATRDLRALLTHRMRLVRIRTMVKNGLQAMALNARLAWGSKLLRQAGLVQLQAPRFLTWLFSSPVCDGGRQAPARLRLRTTQSTMLPRILLALPPADGLWEIHQPSWGRNVTYKALHMQLKGIERDFQSPALGHKVVGSNQGPATTDIRGAQLRGRFDLDALRGPTITEIELCHLQGRPHLIGSTATPMLSRGLQQQKS